MTTSVVLAGGVIVAPDATATSPGELITADYQLEYRGLLLGAGTGYELVELRGLGLAEVRSSDTARPRDHGRFAGTDYLDARVLQFDIEVWAPDADGLAERMDTLTAAFAPGDSEQPLVFQLPGADDKRRIHCRPRRLGYPIANGHQFGVIEALTVECVATDPRVYDNTQQNASVGLATGGGGLEFPATFPVSFGTPGTSNIIDAGNAGTFETRPVARIDGPATNPILENITTGHQLALNGALAGGEFLLVDFAERTVLLNGTASRYGWVDDPDQWWVLVPGSNEVRFSASTYEGGALLTLSWRSARL